jgi:FkbM family methyltransferase
MEMTSFLKILYTNNSKLNEKLIYILRYCALNLFKIYNIKLEFVHINKQVFEEYVKNNIIQEKYKSLICGLDYKSKIIVDTLLNRLLELEKFIYSYKLSVNELKDLSKINKYLGFVNYNDTSFSPDFYKNVFPGFSNYETSVFKFHHGLSIMDKNIVNYLKNKDCIDGGGFEFDSAAIFSSHYPFNKVYSFEIDNLNFERGSKIIGKNYTHLNNIVMIKKGLWNNLEKAKVNSSGDMSSSIEISDQAEIELITIDSFVKENKLELGFIKLDVEGAEYNAILGAKETIKSQLPILSISIYHNLKDFFEIKPLIESIVPDEYNFYIRKLTPFYNFQETYLLAIPKKLNIDLKNSDNIDIYG